MRGEKFPRAVALCGADRRETAAFLDALLPLLARSGLKVAVIRRAVRVSGTSPEARHLQAGAACAAVFDPRRSAVLRSGPVTESHLIAQFPDAQLILLDGFAHSFWPKVELLPPGGRDPVCDPSTLLAVLADAPLALPGVADLPRTPQAAADFLLRLGTGTSAAVSPPRPSAPPPRRALSAAVLTVDDACYVGRRPDEAAAAVKALLSRAGCPVSCSLLLPDDLAMVESSLRRLGEEESADLIFLLGSIGFFPWACGQAAVRALTERGVPGVPEAIRALDFPGAALFAGEAGIFRRSLMINLPGEAAACRAILDAYLPTLLQGAARLRAV